jgi:hypothetical protein
VSSSAFLHAKYVFVIVSFSGRSFSFCYWNNESQKETVDSAWLLNCDLPSMLKNWDIIHRGHISAKAGTLGIQAEKWDVSGNMGRLATLFNNVVGPGHWLTDSLVLCILVLTLSDCLRQLLQKTSDSFELAAMVMCYWNFVITAVKANKFQVHMPMCIMVRLIIAITKLS